MRINRRLCVESLLVTLFMILGMIGWKVAQGMWMTATYVPEMSHSYSSVANLQSQVRFGAVVRWDAGLIFLYAAGFILFAAAYYGIRSGLLKRKQRS
ncbi:MULTISPECIES: hypothetical protein [Paenibacillus]|uniref:Uncharacterized protein n=2 Tax=Paenibacillus illinoisensis TaxID=59845 RepID=A0A2W0C985_9BACL|nr:hypothetical protein [Paenibacillus illinoisensis]PYY28657.1 Uncharacterized protein PIL02S_03863 [Paenibacillus illinoisensis]